MRLLQGDIGLSGELHKLYLEYAKDTGGKIPLPEMWLKRFLDPTFFCLIAKHGKKPVGFVMGRKCSYFSPMVAEVEAVFVRRAFRKFKFVRAFVEASKTHLRDSKFEILAYTKVKAQERAL